jgi:CubicO group peptidase (beta-lactamase class C family)
MLIISVFTNTIIAQTTSIEKRLDSYINSLSDKFSGTILIAIGDKILINKGYGMADIEYDIPNTSSTKYEIGSVTKHFTALLTLKMAEKGLIDVNATIDKYLPDYPKEFASKITIHHLLMHQSGIGQHYNIIPDYFDGQDKLFHSQKEYLQLFWDKKLAHEPGQGMTYSSPGYYLLAVIMEKITNKSYAELLQEYIFNPLDMNNSSVGNNLKITKGKATGYKRGINGLINNRQEEESNCLGAGDIISTTIDLYKFQKIFNHIGDNVITKEYKDLLLKPQTPTFTGYDGNKIFLSYSAEISPVSYNNGKETLNIIWEKSEGSSWGYRARITRFMEKDACYIVLSNVQTDRSMTSDMYNFIEDLLFENLNIDIKKVKNTVTWDAITYESKIPFNTYEGFYKISNNSFIQVMVGNNKLISRSFQNGYGFDNVSQNELISEKENVFHVKGQEGLRYFFTKDSLNSKYFIIQNTASKDTAKLIMKDTNQNLLDYSGVYYSVELQKSYSFEIKDNNLITNNFLNNDNIVFVPLKKDLLGCDRGYLVFHRYSDGTIRDFKFINESLDAFTGSLFIKE